MPRPSKFTEPVKQQILAVLKVGASRATACAVAGINEDTLRVWLKRGEAEERDEGSVWAEFRREVLAAEVELRYKALGVISGDIRNNPSLAWKVVERREPGYAPPQTGTVGATPAVQINLSLGGSSAPLPMWMSGEVVEVDAEESPALPAGDSDAAAPEEES